MAIVAEQNSSAVGGSGETPKSPSLHCGNSISQWYSTPHKDKNVTYSTLWSG